MLPKAGGTRAWIGVVSLVIAVEAREKIDEVFWCSGGADLICIKPAV